MILLLGGTMETAGVARALAGAGRRVLVSTATDVPLEIGAHPNIRRRQGRLDEVAMTELVAREKISVLVDITHPYARDVRATAERVARKSGIRRLAFLRPPACVPGADVHMAPDHETAARLACEVRKPILLTIGSRHVAVYARQAAAAGLLLVARVLSHPASLAACRDAGIPDERIVAGRGPFTVEENRETIRHFGIGVLVTKDGGDAGGFRAKRDAARLEDCCFIVVGRDPAGPEATFDRTDSLVEAVLQLTPGDTAHE